MPLSGSGGGYGAFGLGASARFNPYTSGLGALASNPYALSSAYGNSLSPYSSYGYGSQMDPLGSALLGYGYALQGAASLTQANSRYWIDTQTAAMTREQVRQEALNTERRRIELAQWYDSIRPTAVTLRTQELATELDNARRFAADSDILSGRALNALLDSIQKSARPTGGQAIPLEEDIVRRLNVAPAGGNGNVGMTKDAGKLNWPDALQDRRFDEPRKRLTRNMALAVQTLKDGETLRPDVLRDIRSDARTIGRTLDEVAGDLAPPQYFEARRFVKQLGDAVAALADPKAVNYFNGTWQARGKTVPDLVGQMTRNGLQFAAAADGDEAAYRAVYEALRAYESGQEPMRRSIETRR